MLGGCEFQSGTGLLRTEMAETINNLPRTPLNTSNVHHRLGLILDLRAFPSFNYKIRTMQQDLPLGVHGALAS